jgi:FAD/FMN-containing dehydrogenase
MVCQGLDDGQIKRVWQPFFDWAKSSKDLNASDLHGGAGRARHWWDVVYRKSKGSNAMISDPRPGAPAIHAWWSGDQDQVGAFLHGYDSLWLPAVLLRQDQQQRLADALFAASRHKKVEMHFNKGIAGAPAAAVAATEDTATNPAVVDAFVLVIVADGERPSYPGLARPAMDTTAARSNAHEIDQATAELRKIVPNAGSYVSESNYFNNSWQGAFWGKNYPRLRAIKDKHDPDGLFFVHHGVGSEEWSADGFTQVTKRPR